VHLRDKGVPRAQLLHRGSESGGSPALQIPLKLCSLCPRLGNAQGDVGLVNPPLSGLCALAKLGRFVIRPMAACAAPALKVARRPSPDTPSDELLEQDPGLMG